MFLLLYGEKNIGIIIEPLCFAIQDQRLLCFEKGYWKYYMINQKRHIGIVSGWNRDKQYGFVNSMNNGVSYFLHRSKLDQDVCNGAVVEFEIWNDKEDKDKVFAAKAIVIEMPEKY